MSGNERLSSKIKIEYPDFEKLPERVKQKYESLSTIVNFFRMMGYSPGTFVEIMDLTDAIFKRLTLSDYHKELLVLQVAAHEGSDKEKYNIQPVKELSVFISHGQMDQMLPYEWGQANESFFSNLGANVIFRPYSEPHTV